MPTAHALHGDSTATPRRVWFWLSPPGSGGCSPPVHAKHGVTPAAGMAAAGAPAVVTPATAATVISEAATAPVIRGTDRRGCILRLLFLSGCGDVAGA